MSLRPFNPEPGSCPSERIEPPREIGGWLTLLDNIKDARGPIAEGLRRHARRRLRQAGWGVRRLREPEGRRAAR